MQVCLKDTFKTIIFIIIILMNNDMSLCYNTILNTCLDLCTIKIIGCIFGYVMSTYDKDTILDLDECITHAFIIWPINCNNSIIL